MRKTIAALAFATSLYASDLSNYLMGTGVKVPPTADTKFTAYILTVPAPDGYVGAQFQYSVYAPDQGPTYSLLLFKKEQNAMVMIVDEKADEIPDRARYLVGRSSTGIPLDDKLCGIYRKAIQDIRRRMDPKESIQLAYRAD